MHGRRLGLVLMLMFALVPTGAAQEPEASGLVTLIEDGEGDATVKSGDAEVPVEPWPTADIRSVAWEETPDALRIQVGLAALEQDRPEALIVDDVTVEVRFSHGTMHYLVMFRLSDLVDDPAYFASLYQDDPTASFPSYMQDLDVEVDGAAATLTATVPRAPLIDEDGARLNVGDTVAGIWARSDSVAATLAGAVVGGYTLGTADLEASDTAPDDGEEGAAEWVIQHGVEQKGHIMLFSDRPFRLSNGEATTFLYEIQMENTAGFPDTVTLDHSAAPAGWVVTFPEKDVRIDAGETLDLPILLTVPFNHEHGTSYSLDITGQSRADPEARGSLEIGVRYTEVPQPAGHHDTLYIHLGPQGAYMNTVQEHEGATGDPDPNTGLSGSGATWTYSWFVPLAPALGIGLDFDLDRTGTLSIPITVGGGAVEAYATGEVVMRIEDSQEFFGYRNVVVADLPDTEPRMVTPGEEVTFQLDIHPQEAADRIPYTPGSSFGLEIRVVTTGNVPGLNPAPTASSIQPGGVMELPLNEFHDDVDDYFSALSGVELVPASDQQRLVNPGKTALFEVDAENVGSLEGSFDLELTGTNTEWARILGDTRITLGPGETRPMAVAVAPPAGTADGALADITLHATKSDDPNVRSLIRFLVEVDTDDEHPDDAIEAGDVDTRLRSKETPALGVGSVLGGLAALAMYRRRDCATIRQEP